MKIPLLLVVMLVGCAGKPPKTDPSMQLMPIRSHDETHPPRLPDCPCAGKDLVLSQHCWMKNGKIGYPEGCAFLHAKKSKPAAPRVAPDRNPDPSADAPGDFHPHRGDSADDYVKPFSMSQLNCDDKDQQCLQKKAQSITDMMNEALPEKQEEPSDSHQAWLKDCLKTGDCPDPLPLVIEDFTKHVIVSYDPKTTAVTVTTPKSIIVITPKEKP